MKKTIFIIPIITSLLLVKAIAVESVSGATLLDRVVAAVNDEVITWSELREVLETEGRQLIGNVEDKDKKLKELERTFLNNLIDIRLQLQEARRIGLKVKETEIDNAIEEVKRKYNLTDEALRLSLKAEGLTMEQYRVRLADQILLSKVVNLEVKAGILISDREIEEYYEANKDKYATGEKVRIRQIFFKRPEEESQIAAVEAKASEVMERLNRGEDFASLAGELSEDPSRQFGGDLGYVKRGSILKEVEDVAFGLKVGEVSKPFWSPAGLHIIKLEDRIEDNMEKIREEIKETLFKKAFSQRYNEWLKKLREKAYIEINL